MASDLEAQLRASLPGRETAVQDYARLQVSGYRLRLALELIRSSRGDIAAVLGNDRPAIEHVAAADIEASKAVLDLDRAIKSHPAGRVPR